MIPRIVRQPRGYFKTRRAGIRLRIEREGGKGRSSPNATYGRASPYRSASRLRSHYASRGSGFNFFFVGRVVVYCRGKFIEFSIRKDEILECCDV